MKPEQQKRRTPDVTQAPPPVLLDVSPAPRFQPFARVSEVCKTRRNLPHWTQEGCTYFITFRLADALPKEKLAQWKTELEAWVKAHPKPWTPGEYAEYEDRFPERIQRWMDAGFGSCRLANPAVREILQDALMRFNEERYELIQFVVMPNHVHLLVTPRDKWKLSQILHTWKSFSGHKIVKEFEVKAPFWMDENFDHAVRGLEYLEYYRNYIRDNPVKARLSNDMYTLWSLEERHSRDGCVTK